MKLDDQSRPRRFIAVCGSALALVGVVLLIGLITFDVRDVQTRSYPAPLIAYNVLGREGSLFVFWLVQWVGTAAVYAVGLSIAVLGLTVSRGLLPRSGSIASASWLAGTRVLGVGVVVVCVAACEHLLYRQGLLGASFAQGFDPGGYWGAFAGSKLVPMPGAVAYGMLMLGGTVGLVLACDVGRSGGAGQAGTAVADPDDEGADLGLWEQGLLDAGVLHDWAEDEGEEALEELHEQDVVLEYDEAGHELVQDFEVWDAEDEPATQLLEDESWQDEFDDDEDHEPDELVDAQQYDAEVLDETFDDELPKGEVQPAKPTKPKRKPRAKKRSIVATPKVRDVADLLAAPAVSETYEIDPEAAEALVRTLGQFGVGAQVVRASRGPNITIYELTLEPGIKVSRVVGLADDLALALEAPAVRVHRMPGRGTVAVEVPNGRQETVYLRELLTSKAYKKSKDLALPLFLGKTAGGKPLITDLARMPHLLIAGSTGSGKSVCMNAIIVSLLATRSLRDVKFILIDPKQVELALYESVPHLLAPVVTDMRQVPAVLEWVVGKMEERYTLLRKAKVRHMKDYNALGKAELCERLGVEEEALERRRIPWHMSYIVVVIDEFADLMCQARKEVEMSVVRLAQKSRAVGIHLIVATQRPTTNVITGLIKSNMPCRIAFQVTSGIDSRTILDSKGAESLLGQGDLLFLPPGNAHFVRAQGTFVGDDEVHAVVDYARGLGEPEFDENLANTAAGNLMSDDMPQDDLFDQAVRIVLETQRGSASLLQRRLQVGYTRASRLIDQMSECGILGPHKGSKSREILITVDEWDARVGFDEAEDA